MSITTTATSQKLANNLGSNLMLWLYNKEVTYKLMDFFWLKKRHETKLEKFQEEISTKILELQKERYFETITADYWNNNFRSFIIVQSLSKFNFFPKK